MKPGEAPRGYRLRNGGGKNLERVRDISNGLGGKATAEEARMIARLYFKVVQRLADHVDEEQEDVQAQPLDLMTAALKAGERNAIRAQLRELTAAHHGGCSCGSRGNLGILNGVLTGIVCRTCADQVKKDAGR